MRALRVLGVQRRALVDPPWFDNELNQLGAAYFQPAAVADWTSRHTPEEAQAIFIAGNGFRTAAAIEALEAMIGHPGSGCAVRRGGRWGFEATGPVRLLRGALEHAVGLVFARALPRVRATARPASWVTVT